LGGIRLEGKSGLSHLLSLTWPKGTSQKTAHDVSTLVEGRAASVEGFSGRNSLGLQMTGLSRDWQPLTELFTELLLDPTFPEEEIQHSRRVTEDAIRSIEDHSSQLCSRLFLETLFQSHPYGRLTYGTLDSIQSIDTGQLKSCHQHWLSAHPMVISLSGSMGKGALDSWLQLLEKQTSLLIPGATRSRPPSLATPHIQDEPNLIAPRWVERSLKREQCHLLIGGVGLRMHSQESHTLKLLETLLGGQSGRLFIELREKKSLAYTVAPVSFEGLEKGYVGTYIACAPQKRKEATEGIAKVLETLANRGPTLQEMRRAREFFLGRRAMDLQGDPALASHYGLESLYQLPPLTEEELTKIMNQITQKDIQSLCRKYYVEPYQVTSCVG
jgi:zinc protease